MLLTIVVTSNATTYRVEKERERECNPAENIPNICAFVWCKYCKN